MMDSVSWAEPSGQDDKLPEPKGLSSLPQRACQPCRARKIRCDRNQPCSYCASAKIPCYQPEPKLRAKRVNNGPTRITVEYERKIDAIDRRVDEINSLLEGITRNSFNKANKNTVLEGPSDQTAFESITAPSTSTPGHSGSSSWYNPVVDAASSIPTHSSLAEKFVQTGFQTHRLNESNSGMNKALEALRHIVNSLNRQTVVVVPSYTYAVPTPRHRLWDHKLPPIEKTVSLIGMAKKKPSQMIVWMQEFFPFNHLSDLCLSLYFTKDFSEADFINANMGLMYLFQDHANRVPNCAEETLSFVTMCRGNLETALANLPLYLPNTSDMVFALVLGAFHAVEISKPLLSWTLACKAAEICQTLGFHRLCSMKSDDPNTARHKRFLFWCVYYIDKSLALRLGRAPSIQDWDITVPMPRVDDHHTTPLMFMVSVWLATARCQGALYEMLYCHKSSLQPRHINLSQVQTLADELMEIRKKTSEIKIESLDILNDENGANFIRFVLTSDDVLRLSLLTLAYRASRQPAGARTPFVPQCVDAARMALRRHQDCIAIIEDINAFFLSIYIHWTLLFAPFIPFIVIFCQVLVSPEQDDLELLRSFIVSIESAPVASEAAVKMIHLFQILYRLAIRFTQAHGFCSTVGDADNGDLDTCIDSLGVPEPVVDQLEHLTDICEMRGAAELPSSEEKFPFTSSEFMELDNFSWMDMMGGLEEWVNNNYQAMDLTEEASFDLSEHNEN